MPFISNDPEVGQQTGGLQSERQMAMKSPSELGVFERILGSIGLSGVKWGGTFPMGEPVEGAPGMFDLGDTPTPEVSSAAMKTGAAVLGGEIAAVPAAAMRGAGLGRQVIQGMRQGFGAGVGAGAVEATPEMLAGKPIDAATQMASEVGLNVVAGAGLPIVIRAIGAGIRAGGKPAQFIADLFRPVEMSADQLRALRTRDTILTESGVSIPVGISDAIRSGTLTKRLQGIDGAEPTADDLKQLADLVIHIAANAPRGSRTPQAISQSVFNVLDPQKQGLNRSLTALADRFSTQAANEVNGAESSIRSAFRSFFPSGRTVKDVGEELGDIGVDALNSARSVWDKAYKDARGLPDYSKVLVDLVPVSNTAANLGLAFAKNSSGNFSIIGAPSGVRSTLTAGENLANTASLDEARSLVTELNRNLRNRDYLPNVDFRTKLQLLDEIKGQIDSAVSTYPALKTALDSANRIYAENIGRFRNNFAEGLLKEVGEKGGLSGEQIVSKLTGANALTNIEQLKNVLGLGATAGADYSTRGMQLVREAILSTAATAGRTGGEVNLGAAFGTIDKLYQKDPSLFAKMFPNYKAMRALFLREGKIPAAKANSADAELFLDSLKLGRSEMEEALTTGGVANLEATAKAVVANTRRIQDRLKSLGMDELVNQDAFNILTFIKDQGNVAKIGNLASQLAAKDPRTLTEVRALFIEELLNKATKSNQAGDRMIDADEFLRLIQSPKAAGGAATGRPAGIYHDPAKSLLGGAETLALENSVQAMRDLPLPAMEGVDVKRSLLNYLIGGYSGGPATFLAGAPTVPSVMTAANRLAMALPELRYKLAAAFLSDQNLRREAMKPIGTQSARVMNRAATLAAELIGQQYGPNSAAAKEFNSFTQALENNQQSQ